MRKFEYEYRRYSSQMHTNYSFITAKQHAHIELNKMGNLGLEAISINTSEDNQISILFKREKV